jgi:DNA gyrase subunit A
MHIDSIRTMGRAAQGVKLINLKGKSEIAAVARVPRSEDEDEDVVLDENGEVVHKILDSKDLEPKIDNEATEENGTDIENDPVE